MDDNKTLVFTDVLPSKYMTAGNVLSLLHDELATEQQLVYICLHDLQLDYVISDQIGSQSIHMMDRPIENWNIKIKTKLLGYLINMIGEILSIYDNKYIGRKVLEIVNRENPSRIVHVIESKSSIQLSNLLLNDDRLNSTQIAVYWDPVDWWINARETNSFVGKYLRYINKKNILMYNSILVPSDNMKNHFFSLGATKIETLYPFYE